MMGAVHDWSHYLSEIFRVTAPGGHIQLTEMRLQFISKSGTLGDDAAVRVLERVLPKYAACNRYDFGAGPKLVRLAESAGFHSVDEQVVEVPCSPVSSCPISKGMSLMVVDVKMSRVGKLMMDALTEGVAGWGRRAMIETGIIEEAADLYIESICQELKDARRQLFVKVYPSPLPSKLTP